MSSLRHKSGSGSRPGSRPDSPGQDSAARGRDPRDGYLDAARECILDVGWRRTTLTEVARRAGVSRMTIYRSWSDMEQLLGDLMTREWTEIVTAVASAAGPEGEPIAMLRRVLPTVVGGLRSNELFLRIVELDPELILPYVLARRGRSQDAVLALLEQVVARGQHHGEVRAGNPTAIARALVLAVHGFVLSMQTMVDDQVSEADLHGELGRLVEGILAR